MRLPRSYVREDSLWRGPRGGFIRLARRPHVEPEPCTPGYVCTGGPSCYHEVGERTLSLEGVAYWPVPGGLRWTTIATWRESEATDVVVTGGAMDAEEQREQLRIIHSLRL